jgi:hypothetical protein
LNVDNRKHKRRSLDGVIDLTILDNTRSDEIVEEAGSVTGKLSDISRSGIGMRSTNPIMAGTTVVVKRLQMVRDVSGHDILGHVAWIKAMGDMYWIGISLEEEMAQDLHPDLN